MKKNTMNKKKTFFLLLLSSATISLYSSDQQAPTEETTEKESLQDALFHCCVNNKVAELKSLLKTGAQEFINSRNGLDYTPLMMAAFGDHTKNGAYEELVKELIKSGASINDQGRDNLTALHIACRMGYVNVVEELIKNGANCSLRTE